MSQKRFTRSNTIATRNNNTHQKHQEQMELPTKIRQAIADHKFYQALALIKAVPSQNHWTTCLKALVLFQMGNISRSLNAVRNALRIQRKNCTQCLTLLLKIIDRSSPNFNPFLADITKCLGFEGIPQQIKNQFEVRKSQIHLQEEPHSEITKQDRQKFKDMTQYYEQKGLMFNKVQIVEVDQQYRVARAKSTIRPNQVIIFVPQNQMITLELAKSMEQISRLQKEQVKLKSPKHCLLSIFLLFHMQMGQSSPYYNYIQCLPKKLNNFPIYYSDQLLQELKGTTFLSLIKKKKSDIEEDFKEITAILPQYKQIITFQKFSWARMIVSSRIFGVVINEKKTDALVPIADMLNHKIPKMTSWYFCDQRKGFIVQNTEQQIPKGDEIFDSYGLKCNSRFLLNYGFTIPENSYNQVMVSIRRKRSSKIVCPNPKLTARMNTQQFKQYISYYRLYALEQSQNDNFDHYQSQKRGSNFISSDNQCEAWKMIQQNMKQQLQQYKTTIKLDEKLLRSPQPLSINLRNCIQIRLGEKRVLDFYARAAKKIIQYFARKRRNIDAKIYQEYLKEVQQSLSPVSQ